MAVHRCLAVDGRQRRQGHPERAAGRRMGHPHGRLPSGRLERRARRRGEEGGSRREGRRRVGRGAERGGTPNGRGGVYSTPKYLDWRKNYAPPQAQGMTFSESGPVPAQGAIAQQIFWYTAFTAD